eukprot:scaffold47559_cov65-Phaeocystis_antarctica.AAC.2
MPRDAFPSRELSLSGSSRCSSQPPSTRRVGSGKLHSTHAWSSDWVSMEWREHTDYSQGALGAPFGSPVTFGSANPSPGPPRSSHHPGLCSSGSFEARRGGHGRRPQAVPW